jgi:hypothetical protein
MKLNILYILILSFVVSSCEQKMYVGTYNTNYSKDKSAFFQIKLNADRTAEKIEIHTISIIQKGKWIQKNNKIICYLDSSKLGFLPDTLNIRIRRNKLYFARKGEKFYKTYLLKNLLNN